VKAKTRLFMDRTSELPNAFLLLPHVRNELLCIISPWQSGCTRLASWCDWLLQFCHHQRHCIVSIYACHSFNDEIEVELNSNHRRLKYQTTSRDCRDHHTNAVVVSKRCMDSTRPRIAQLRAVMPCPLPHPASVDRPVSRAAEQYSASSGRDVTPSVAQLTYAVNLRTGSNHQRQWSLQAASVETACCRCRRRDGKYTAVWRFGDR